MALSRNFILTRAQKTCAVATAITGTWTWDRFTLTEMNLARTGGEGQLDVVTGAGSATALARGQLDSALQALYDLTVQGLALARRHFGSIPGKELLFANIESTGSSREGQRATVRKFLKAWAQADTAWTLNLLSGSVGFTTYQNNRNAIEGNDTVSPPVAGLVDALALAEQLERREAESLNMKLAALDDMMVAWYGDATAACPAGSAEGDQIRGQIPTTYDPNNEPLPIPPTPSGLAAQTGPAGGSAEAVCLPATFAAEYVWTASLLSDPTQVFQVTTTGTSVQFTGLPVAATIAITVAAQNATGISAPSAPANTETGA